jgi:general secretion pathway protein J
MRRSQRGMTLIEIMISLAIIGAMMAMAWTTISSASNARNSFLVIEERNHEIRVALARMVNDLEAAYLSKNEDTNFDNRRTMFIGKSEEVRFSTFSHVTLWADANESDATVIVYYIDDDRGPDSHGKKALYRKEMRRQSNESWEGEPGELDILLHDVEEIELQYWEWKDKKWKETWDTTKQDGEKDRLPFRVRIHIKYKNPRGDELELMTQARVLLQERWIPQ